jgi:sirohydrochlorin ferrochelatase
MEDIGILVLGHGSRLPYNKELVETYAAIIQESHSGPVKTGYLNMNEPRISDALMSFSGLKVKKIIALPIFLAHGVHTKQDIPRELGVDESNRREIVNIDGEEVEVICAEPLGSAECIADLAYKRVGDAVRQ